MAAHATSTSRTDIPRYAELPFHEAIRGRVSWGVFGNDDNLGTLNFIDTEAVLRGVASVREGSRFNLSLPLDLPNPPLSARLASGPEMERRFVHHRIKLRTTINDDYLDNYFLQSSTQIDGLRHVGAHGPVYYSGISEEMLLETDRLGVSHIAEAGLATRGVLVDVSRLGPELGWQPSEPISVETLMSVLQREDVELLPGDALLLRTGYLEAYLQADPAERVAMAEGTTSPGLAAEEAMASWLWNKGVAAVGADNPGVEVMPGQKGEFLHRRLITGLGMTFIEWLDLEALSRHSASIQSYDCLFVAVPLNLKMASGSPANALGIR
jgi:kynurenine formamidase